MSLGSILQALAVTFIWGINFIFITIALDSFPPLFLTAGRFILAALPVVFLPRPAIPLKEMLLIAAFLFVGQYALLFLAMENGVPPGLASLLQQLQVPFTILFAWILMKERPRRRQILGTLLAVLGLILTAMNADTLEYAFTFFALMLMLGSAMCFGLGNALLRQSSNRYNTRMGPALICWLSIPPIIPLLALSFAVEGPGTVFHALTHAHIDSILALCFTAFISTLVGFALWGNLLKRYPAAMVTPFALLIPVFGIISSALLTGESFVSPTRIAGMGLMLFSLALIVLPVEKWLKKRSEGKMRCSSSI